MNKDIKQIERKIQRSSYEDGLNEIAFGLITLLLAIYFFLQSTLSPETLLYQILVPGFLIIMVGGGLIIFRLSAILKDRFTFPRTGYVTFPQPRTSKLLMTGLISMLLAVMLVVLLRTAPSTLISMPSLSAFVIAIAFLIVGWRLNLLRYYLLSLASLLIGVGLRYLGLSELIGLSYFYALLSLSLLVAGISIFLRFIRQTQPPTD